MATITPQLVTLTDGTPLWIRSAEPGDIPGVVALREELVVSSPHQVSGPRDTWTHEMAAERIRHATESRGHLWLVASTGREPGSEVVGSINFRSEDRKRIEHHGSFGIGNHSSWRGRGVGTALIEALLNWAAADPIIEKVTLGSFANNVKARRLYRRMGFRTEARSKRFFKIAPGEYVDDIQMCIYVKPGVAPDGFVTWQVRKD